MEKYHELTKRLGLYGDSYTDSIIRKWLEERARELSNWYRYSDGSYGHSKHLSVLGLTDDGEKDCGPNGCEVKPCSHEPQKQSWCEHIQCSSDDYSIKETGTLMGGKNAQFQFKFCPICGTPRPTPKSLVDKFREKTCYLLPDKDNPSTNKTGRLTSGSAGRLARIAEEHFGKTDFLREHKEEL